MWETIPDMRRLPARMTKTNRSCQSGWGPQTSCYSSRGWIIEPFDTSPSPCALVEPRSGVEGRKYPYGGVIAMVMDE